MSIRNQLHVQEYMYDFSVSGGAVSTIELSALAGKSRLPVGAVVKSVFGKVVTACTSGGSATVTWGNADVDGYSGATIAVASLVDNAVFNGWDNASALLWDDTNDHPIFYPITTDAEGAFNVAIATATLTAGKIVFCVEYYMPTVD